MRSFGNAGPSLAMAFLAATGLGACDRTDSDRDTTAAPTRSVDETPGVEATDREPATPEPSCVVPLADPAPPEAVAASECPTAPTSGAELNRGWVVFKDAPGAPRVAVEVAQTTEERQRGLMYRTSLGDEEGMLFSWDEEARRSFWMRNTCIPLDMMFVSADGFIVGILEQVPVMNEASRSVPCPAQYVIEVNAGWSRAHGVEPGQLIELDT